MLHPFTPRPSVQASALPSSSASTPPAAPTAIPTPIGRDRPRGSPRQCEVLDLSHTLTPYVSVWKLQKDLVSHRKETLLNGSTVPRDILILCQHPPVYTLGTRSSLGNLKFDQESPPDGAELHVTERGGEVTFHGPGQLVAYPILDLRHHSQDLHWYLRSLEEVVIRTLRAAAGIQAGREEGMTGVWAGGEKIAAMGVRVAQWITYHGVAINISTDLAGFSHIVPCGLTLPVGSVEQCLRRTRNTRLTSGTCDTTTFPKSNDSAMPAEDHVAEISGEREDRSDAHNGAGSSKAATKVLPSGGLRQDQLMRKVVQSFQEEFRVVFNVELLQRSQEDITHSRSTCA